MASIRRQKKTWFACISLADGERTQRSTGIKDVGTPEERAANRRKALLVAQEYEAAGRGDRTETQIRKAITDLFQRVSGRRIEHVITRKFLGDWLHRVKLRRAIRTHADYEKTVTEFLEFLGPMADKPLSDVTPKEVQDFVNTKLARGLRAKTARKIAAALSAPFSLALRQGLIVSNPVAAAELPDDPSESRHPFTPVQVARLIKSADGDWKTLIMLGAYLGARLSDCASLRWENIDLAGKTVRYRPQKTARHRKDVVCPLHASLEAHLLRLPSADEPTAALCPTLSGRYTGGRTGLSAQFRKIMTDAGIETETVKALSDDGRDFNRLGFHSFRHSFKSALVNAGIEVETVDVLTGHAKQTVSERYIHRSPELLRQAITRLPDYAKDVA